MYNEPVLVVDDENTVRSVLSEIITSFGYGCVTAADGYEALQLVQEKEFGLILSDIRMPKMDGFDLMKEVREIRPDTPFIIITGYTNDYTSDSIFEAGASELIKKPFKISEIKYKLSRFFHERRLYRENKRLLLEQEKLNEKFSAILKMSRNLTGDLNFEQLLEHIIGNTSEIMEAERTSLYLIDWEKKENMDKNCPTGQ